MVLMDGGEPRPQGVRDAILAELSVRNDIINEATQEYELKIAAAVGLD